MRGHTFFSYALVALATSVCAAPLEARTNEVVEKRDGPLPHQLAKIGTANVVREYFYRRQDDTEVDAAA
jgi:hypothetical protein